MNRITELIIKVMAQYMPVYIDEHGEKRGPWTWLEYQGDDAFELCLELQEKYPDKCKQEVLALGHGWDVEDESNE